MICMNINSKEPCPERSLGAGLPRTQYPGLVWLAVAFTLLAPASFGEKAPWKLEPGASCTTSECHAGIADFPHVHGPVAMGECDMCHFQEKDRHRFAEIKNTPKLCTNCHDKKDTGKNVHMPAAEDCVLCHDPHGSAAPKMLRADDQRNLCFMCHDEALMAGGHQHGPAAVGACSVCHNPHSSDEDKLLRAPVNEVCAMCHSDLIAKMTSGTYLHEPVKEKCTHCHNPHSGARKKMLPATMHELCGKCHAEIVNIAKTATTTHAPAVEPDGCLECHAPHGANAAPQLKMPQLDLCLSCHDEPVQAEDRMLTDMKALLEDNDDWHGPILEGGCTGCHQPHGSTNFRLLKKPYPPNFYSAYDPEKYALCFTCHEPSMVREENTQSLTGFRNGKKNLHFLHVNKAERGRTCRACHEVHASPNPRHIRDSVPYGNWELPINFVKTETGGSCKPGCHEPKEYDRR